MAAAMRTPATFNPPMPNAEAPAVTTAPDVVVGWEVVPVEPDPVLEPVGVAVEVIGPLPVLVEAATVVVGFSTTLPVLIIRNKIRQSGMYFKVVTRGGLHCSIADVISQGLEQGVILLIVCVANRSFELISFGASTTFNSIAVENHLLCVRASRGGIIQTLLNAGPRLARDGAKASSVGVFVFVRVTTSSLNGIKTTEAAVRYSCETDGDIFCRVATPNQPIIIRSTDKGQNCCNEDGGPEHCESDLRKECMCCRGMICCESGQLSGSV